MTLDEIEKHLNAAINASTVDGVLRNSIRAKTALQQFRKDHVIIAKGDVPDELCEAVNAINYVKGEYSAGCLDRKDVDLAYQICDRLIKIEKTAALVAKQMGGE